MLLRQKNNNWLVDREFLISTSFSDKEYLIQLGKTLHSYLQTLPIVVFVGWDKVKHDRLYLNVGNFNKCLYVKTDISPNDFITLVRKNLKRFFPQYACHIDEFRKLTEDEILEYKKECEEKGEQFKLETALKMTKAIKVFEWGIIEKVMLLKDTFILNVNGTKYVYKTVTVNQVLPIKQFLSKCRELVQNKSEDQIQLRNYILENSTCIEKLENPKQIPIMYIGDMLHNFFRINYSNQAKDEMIQDVNNSRVYSWGRFIVTFQNDTDLNRNLQWMALQKQHRKVE